MNKVVARFADGRTLKGVTSDFVATKEAFHIQEALGASKAVEVHIGDLKAIFFVKDLTGNAAHNERNEFDPSHPAAGRKIRVEFKDGEVLVGTTTGYQPNRPGFFIVPADAGSNIERCFVISAATRQVGFV